MDYGAIEESYIFSDIGLGLRVLGGAFHFTGTAIAFARSTSFRKNLAKLTGILPTNAHAHHVFCVQFEKEFTKMGINIHQAKYGAWWSTNLGAAGHQQKSKEYARKWIEFFQENPNATAEKALARARELAKEFGFEIKF